MTPKTDSNRTLASFWAAPYRPLFLAAYLCAFITVGWWPLGDWIGLPGPACTPKVLWHVHELIFGFAGAAIGGYILTALPGWTRALPTQGSCLKALFALWLGARIATAFACNTFPFVPLAFNAGYFGLLAVVVGRHLWCARAFNKLGFLCAILALGISEALFMSATSFGMPWVAVDMTLPMTLGATMLLNGVGSRAIPAFTSNWLLSKGRSNTIPLPMAAYTILTQALLVVCILAALNGWSVCQSLAMIATALLLIWQMRRWQTFDVLANPLLAALHLSYLWLPIGLLIMGLSGLVSDVYRIEDALHAITIGGLSGLIMAISGRAAAHTKAGDMKARNPFVVGVVLVWMSAVTRLTSPLMPAFQLEVLAAVVWCIGWAVFTVGFLPALTGPVHRPAFSGTKYNRFEKIRDQ